MAGRLLRLTGTVVVMAAAVVTPPLVMSVIVSSPAFGDVLVDGCTVVSNPTPSDHTNCPGADLAGSSLRGLDLSYANLAGAIFVTCTNGPPASAANCIDADLTDARLTQANLSGAVLSANTTLGPISIYGLATGDANLTGADLDGADLAGATGGTFAGANLSGANLTNGNFGTAVFNDANLTEATLSGAVMTTTIQPFGVTVSATFTGANLTGTILVPPNQTVTAISQTGAVVTWSTPASDPRRDARQLYSAVGVDLRALHQCCHLSSARQRGRRRHRDLRGHRGANDAVLHPGRRPLQLFGTGRSLLSRRRGR